MIETVTIWKREYDGWYSICVLKRGKEPDTFTRHKAHFPTITQCLQFLNKMMVPPHPRVVRTENLVDDEG